MNSTRYLLILVMSGLMFGCGSNPGNDPDDDEQADDDAADDDVSDDDSEDDCASQESDVFVMEVTCTESVPDSDPAGGQGTWEFDLTIDGGWADETWVETLDISSDLYWGGGYDPQTGDPAACPTASEMEWVENGWDEQQGCWERWQLSVDYHKGLDDPCLFPFSCDEAAAGIDLWTCACYPATENCLCSQVEQ